MDFPTPDDLRSAPLWDLYIFGQATSAARGLIPKHALAFGVEIERERAVLRYQLRKCTKADEQDMLDILSEFESLVGPEVITSSSFELVSKRRIAPDDGVWWAFLSRAR